MKPRTNQRRVSNNEHGQSNGICNIVSEWGKFGQQKKTDKEFRLNAL